MAAGGRKERSNSAVCPLNAMRVSIYGGARTKKEEEKDEAAAAAVDLLSCWPLSWLCFCVEESKVWAVCFIFFSFFSFSLVGGSDARARKAPAV